MPSAVNGAPWYSGMDPDPNTNAPPWIHTMTGQGPAGADSPAGANTLSTRQSSPDETLSVTPVNITVRGSRDWAATAPNRVASRTPVHGAGGWGGRNRSGPT